MEHPRFLYDLKHCSIRRALDELGEKWTLLVLREAFYGLCRFDDFAPALGCGRGVLSARARSVAGARMSMGRVIDNRVEGSQRCHDPSTSGALRAHARRSPRSTARWRLSTPSSFPCRWRVTWSPSSRAASPTSRCGASW